MRALVLLRGGSTVYALDVAAAGAVLEPGGLEALPDPLPGVLGLLRTPDAVLPVLAPFGAEGAHVVVVRGPGGPFGLLVTEVIGVVKVDRAAVGPAPAGQETAVVAGVVRARGAEALLLDPAALAGRLQPA